MSDWVNQELKQKGWSMRELARRGDITHGTVSKVLSGKQNPGNDFYLGMARAFGFPLDSIERLDREGVTPLDPDPEYIIDNLLGLARSLPIEQQKELLRFAHYLSWRLSQNLPL